MVAPPTGSQGRLKCQFFGTGAGSTRNAGVPVGARSSEHRSTISWSPRGSVRRRRGLLRAHGGARGAAVSPGASEGGKMIGWGCGKGQLRAGPTLGAFRRRPRASLFIVPCSLRIARCVVRRRFSRLRPKIPTRAARHPFKTSNLIGCSRCVRLAVPCTHFCAARHRLPAAF